MVDFLLHNSLGAWWVTRHPGKACPVPLTYLRTLDDGTPVAGKFESWPDTLAEFKLLDPCCGSGHFLVAAFLMLAPMRMATEGLSAMEATTAVLNDNLFGLEIDPRCVEISVFALAFAAWRVIDEAGNPLGVHSSIPAPNIACCGLKVAGTAEDWEALVPTSSANEALLRQELRLLHSSFAQAPLLGSLLDPSLTLANDLVASNFENLKALLDQALSSEQPKALSGSVQNAREETWDLAVSAKGLLEVAKILEDRYHLVVTNVPYLARGKQTSALKDFCDRHYADAKKDLANVFLERCIRLAREGGGGFVQIVMPQNWLFLGSYKKQREERLRNSRWVLLGLLGSKGFQTPMWDFNVQLLTLENLPASSDFFLHGLDVSTETNAELKSMSLRVSPIVSINQAKQLQNPDSRIVLEQLQAGERTLESVATINPGISPGDTAFVRMNFWEPADVSRGGTWNLLQSTPEADALFGGCYYVCRNWEGPHVANLAGFRLRGKKAWGKSGVLMAKMAALQSSLYAGEAFDANAAVITPLDQSLVTSVISFCADIEYRNFLRKLDRKTDVSIAAMLKVPFDADRWKGEALKRFPDGSPKPFSNDPTQWIFHGHPRPSSDPLQVAVARLLGFTWPSESDEEMKLSGEAHTWIRRCKDLACHADDDGIVCLQSVRGEKPAHERLLSLLIDSWETVDSGSWKASVLDRLLAEAEFAGKGLDVWLQEKFFEQHAKCFHHRPFIWHVWDGLKDGFGALVNYHKLDAKNLERLIHTYLGDWIRQQEAGVRDSVDGAQTRLAAAQDLKRRLELILEGDAPYDIFVRWKTLAEQPIGWNPDLNDGVRLNIRPFMTADVLRHNKKPKLNISWEKDRGKDVDSAPWFKVFGGDRVNEHHLALAEKETAKKQEGKS